MWRQYIAMKAYLFMIARNLHNDWRRREAPRAEFTASDAIGVNRSS